MRYLPRLFRRSRSERFSHPRPYRPSDIAACRQNTGHHPRLTFGQVEFCLNCRARTEVL